MAVSDLSLMSDPGYKAAWDKLMELKTQLTEAERNISELGSRAPGDEVVTAKQRKVTAILQGENPDSVEGSDWRNDLRKARERRNLLYEAEREQQRVLATERIRASKIIAERVKPEYSEAVREIAQSLVKLGMAVLKERSIGEPLRAEDISFYQVFQPQPFNVIGNPHDSTSRISLWLKEAVRLEYIREDDIPKAWREAWRKGIGLHEYSRPKKGGLELPFNKSKERAI